LSEYHCAHTWNFLTASVHHVLGLLISISSRFSAVKYSCTVAITLNTQSASSNSKTQCLRFSNMARILRPITQTKTSCLTLRSLPSCNDVVPAFWLLWRLKVYNVKPPCRYLRFRRTPLLDRMKLSDMISATVTFHLHLSSGKLRLWL
jgi:hypothetical protein